MLTANEIRNITFTKSMGGYKTAEVDVFLDQCADTVAALTSAKAELEKQKELLADKILEYRNDEDSIRTALLSAQRLGDTVVRESNHKAALILEDANIKAQKIVENAERSILDQQEELERIRREITNFKARMLSIYREHLALIDVLPEVHDEPETAPEEQAEPADSAAATEPAAPAFEPVEAPAAEVVEESNPAPEVVLDLPILRDEDEVPVEPARESGLAEPATSRFGELKFGDDYDISKDNEDPILYRRKK